MGKKAKKEPAEVVPLDPEKNYKERQSELLKQARVEEKHSRYNLNKIQESSLKVMRGAKTKQLRREVEIVAQTHERDVDRKDALLQMLDRDLDEAEEQQLAAVRVHLSDVRRLMELQDQRLARVRERFARDVDAMVKEYSEEQQELIDKHAVQSAELQWVIQQVEREEKAQEQQDIAEHQQQFEMIRNKNIEEDHQMRSALEEKIEVMKDKCSTQLTNYKTATESNTQDYKASLARDFKLSKKVEQKLRQVDRYQAAIQGWRQRAAETRLECEERNEQLRKEKEHVARHYHQLKSAMTKQRTEERKRLTHLTVNARRCKEELQSTLQQAERILRLGELCAKFETEREKVLPHYLNTEIDVDSLQFGDEELKDQIKETLSDTGIDKWNYLDNFFKRYNKVALDNLAIDRERQRLNEENAQLKSILKQFLDGVSVNQEVLSKPNPLLVVNSHANLNYVPTKRGDGQPVVIEAATTTVARPR